MIDVGLLHAGVAKVIIVLAKKWMGCFVRRAGHSGTRRGRFLLVILLVLGNPVSVSRTMALSQM